MENSQPVSISGQEEQQGAGRHYPVSQNPSYSLSASAKRMAQENRPRTGSKKVLEGMSRLQGHEGGSLPQSTQRCSQVPIVLREPGRHGQDPSPLLPHHGQFSPTPRSSIKAVPSPCCR